VPAIVIDPSSWTTDQLTPAIEWLRAGGVVAFPTDTLYGLAVDPLSSHAVHALFDLKGRVGNAALPLIAASIAQVESFCGGLDADSHRLAARFWPGPLSIVCAAPATVDPGVHAGQGTIAIRVPNHPVAQALAASFGRPVTATSANLSGKPPAQSAAELTPDLTARIFVIDAGPAAGGAPSTIVDVRMRPPRLIRDGAVPWNRVLESLQA
jgi:L-threonylcarbamoyladenylate synthase